MQPDKEMNGTNLQPRWFSTDKPGLGLHCERLACRSPASTEPGSPVVPFKMCISQRSSQLLGCVLVEKHIFLITLCQDVVKEKLIFS